MFTAVKKIGLEKNPSDSTAILLVNLKKKYTFKEKLSRKKITTLLSS